MIGQTIQNAIYPARIVAIDGDTVTIGQGGKTFARNEIYELVQLGERMIDPYTKESLGRKENIIGMIEITEVTPKMAYGKILNSSIKDLESQFKPKSFIVRSLPESMKKKDTKKKQEDMRKKIEEDFDENW